MRKLASSLVLLLAAGAAVSTPGAAHADTGGSRLFYIDFTKIWTAPAASPDRRSRVPKPHTSDGTPVYPEQAVPSPRGKRLAISMHARRAAGQLVFVTGPRGQHPVQVARYDNGPDAGPTWSIDSLAWRGEHRLYFSLSDGTTTTIKTIRVPAHGKPGPVREMPNSSGLTDLSVDPTSKRLAAASRDEASCLTAGPDEAATSTIVVLNLRTHHRRSLATVTDPEAGYCPVTGPLHWSPDGSQIAFEGFTHQARAATTFTRVVKTVATGGHQSHKPRIVSPRLGKFYVDGMAWQSAHSLWFSANNQLFSIRYRHGRPMAPQQRTHEQTDLKFAMSFG